MKIILENTTKEVELNGVPARLWEGETDTGIKVHCFITRIAIHNNERQDVVQQFQSELHNCRVPSPELQLYPLRMIL